MKKYEVEISSMGRVTDSWKLDANDSAEAVGIVAESLVRGQTAVVKLHGAEVGEADYDTEEEPRGLAHRWAVETEHLAVDAEGRCTGSLGDGVLTLYDTEEEARKAFEDGMCAEAIYTHEYIRALSPRREGVRVERTLRQVDFDAWGDPVEGAWEDDPEEVDAYGYAEYLADTERGDD